MTCFGQAGELRDALCERLRAETTDGTTRAPAELLKHSGRAARELAFAALARRDPPRAARAGSAALSATLAQVRGSALLEHRAGVKEIEWRHVSCAGKGEERAAHH